MAMSGRKILLVEPPFYRLFKSTYSLDRYPLSLAYLAGAVGRDTEWGVSTYNADFQSQTEPMRVSYLAGKGFRNYLSALGDLSGPVWNEVRATIADVGPDVVGISAKSQNFASACAVAAFAKEYDSGTLVVMGGPHPSMVGPDILACADVDVCCIGEGELTLVELLQAVQAARAFRDIDGIIYREGKQIVHNQPRELIDDLDSLPFPHTSAAGSLVNYEQYPITALANIMAIRGCPHSCTFCGSHKIWSRRVRFRSPPSVVAELQALREKGLRFLHFDDDTFGVRRKYLLDLCEAIRTQCPRVRWSCEIHVNLVDEETISQMKAAGCHAIQIGIESGNDAILAQVRKQFVLSDALRACGIIKRHGIELTAFYMVGFPQETEDTLRDTADAIKRTACDTVVLSIFTPYPGTEAFETCREDGLIGDDYDVSLYNHQSPANCFCRNIPRERFRQLASQIAALVDRRNALNRFKRLFSFKTLRRARQLGAADAVRKAARTFLRK